MEEYALTTGLDSYVVEKMNSINDYIAMTVIEEEFSDRVRTSPAYVSRVLKKKIREHD